MKLPLLDGKKNKTGEQELPIQFSEEFRPDLIARAVHALQSAARQAYGADQEAGLRHSSKLSKERKHYRGCYGFGISRVNRKIMSRRGTRLNWVGAFSPQTRGGHQAHPPKSWKIWEQKINNKENQKAIRSALAATLNKSLVEKRGHKIPSEYPFIIDSSIEKCARTQDLTQQLIILGFEKELERANVRKVRAGVGKTRGRRYRQKKSLLIVVGSVSPLVKAAQNLPGVDVITVKALNAELLAPGALAGRATLWTKNAIETIAKNNMFK
jgi:large subunit ribosomal protein L4e